MLAPKPKEEEKIVARIHVTNPLNDDYIPTLYRTFPCETESVTEALKGELPYWTNLIPILIDAGTSKGKTTFVYKELIPRALAAGKHVILISNRIALSLQMKRDVMALQDSPLQNRLTDQGIRETDIFGSVAVVSYQSLPRFLNDPANAEWLKNVLYMVADECHYFTADSSFNKNCEYHLKLITKHFSHAVRIYMTATSWSVLDVLAKAEAKISCLSARFRARSQGLYFERTFYRYHWEADYSHVDLQFVENLEAIKALIHRNSEEKFLIFVDNKEKGKSLAQGLGNRATYLDADSKGTKEMEELLKASRFGSQVLVTTKVLDCGINIWDTELRNVVVATDDRTSLVQMLGRKRCKPGERVNLYVCDIDHRVLAKRYTSAQELLTMLKRYENAGEEERRKMGREIWNSDDERLRLYFRLTDSTLVPNCVAFYALMRKSHFYAKLLSGELTFREAVCEWLGKTLEPEAVPTDELTTFCEAHLGEELSEEEIKTVRELIVKAAGSTGFVEPQPTRVATLGREALNNRMAKFSCAYRIDRSMWKIVKEA